MSACSPRCATRRRVPSAWRRSAPRSAPRPCRVPRAIRRCLPRQARSDWPQHSTRSERCRLTALTDGIRCPTRGRYPRPAPHRTEARLWCRAPPECSPTAEFDLARVGILDLWMGSSSCSCERGWATGRRSGAVCGLRSGAAVRKDAELVPLWVGKYHPALIADLAYVGVSST
jgi:hypothetical protein